MKYQFNSLPTLVRFPFPTTVTRKSRRLQRLPLPKKASIIASSLLRIYKSRIRSMKLHKLIRRRILPMNSRHVRVGNPGKSSVRRLNLLIRSHSRNSKNLVKRRARRFSSGGCCRNEYSPWLYIARWWWDGFAGESGGGERCWKHVMLQRNATLFVL